MPNGYGYGYGRGYGFRGASPPWPYVGRGRGGLPRCWSPGLAPGGQGYAGAWGAQAYGAAPTREQELAFLSSQAEALKQQLQEVERRVAELKKE